MLIYISQFSFLYLFDAQPLFCMWEKCEKFSVILYLLFALCDYPIDRECNSLQYFFFQSCVPNNKMYLVRECLHIYSTTTDNPNSDFSILKDINFLHNLFFYALTQCWVIAHIFDIQKSAISNSASNNRMRNKFTHLLLFICDV